MDLDAGLQEPILDLGAELACDLDLVRAQGDVLVDVLVVRVGRGEVAERRLGLDVDEMLEVVDLEQRLRRIRDLPDDDRGDLDRVAVVVVDLEARRLEVADTHGDLAALGQRVDPVQALLTDGPVVATEQHEDPRSG